MKTCAYLSINSPVLCALLVCVIFNAYSMHNQFILLSSQNEGSKENSPKPRQELFKNIAQRGDTQRAEELMGRSNNTVDEDGMTLLHHAAYQGNQAFARWLLAHGADSNARDNGRGTPLHQAALANQREFAVFLIQQGADIRAQASAGAAPVHYAAMRGHVDFLTWLEQAYGTSILVTPDINNTLPLHYAAHYGHVRATLWLIEHTRASVNERDGNGAAPLHYAARRNNSELIAILLGYGAHLHALDNNPLPPIGYAVVTGAMNAMKLLLTFGESPSLIDPLMLMLLVPPHMLAALTGAQTLIERLLPNLIKLPPEQARDELGKMLLFAAGQGHSKIVELLLNQPKELLDSVMVGEALGRAASAGHQATVEILVVYLRARLRERDYTPAQLPLPPTGKRGNPEHLETSRVNIIMFALESALVYAAAQRHTDLVRYLLRQGVSGEYAYQRVQEILKVQKLTQEEQRGYREIEEILRQAHTLYDWFVPGADVARDILGTARDSFVQALPRELRSLLLLFLINAYFQAGAHPGAS
jgi:ankyrin repeat protein